MGQKQTNEMGPMTYDLYMSQQWQTKNAEMSVGVRLEPKKLLHNTKRVKQVRLPNLFSTAFGSKQRTNLWKHWCHQHQCHLC